VAEESPAPRTQAGGGAQRAALGAALIVIAVVGVVYWLYVRRQREYFTARDLRVLHTMTSALDDLIAANSGYVKNAVRYGDPSVIPVSENCGEKINEADNRALPERLRAMPGNEWFTRQLKPSGKEFVLRLGYYAMVGPTLPKIGADVPPPQASQATTAPPAPTLRRGCTDVTLSDLLQPAFNVELAQVFDTILVASSDGHVLYRVQPPHSRSTLLFANAQGTKSDGSGSPVQIEELGALAEAKGWRDTKPLDLAALRRVTRTTDVVLSDDSYILFSQPYALSVTTTTTAGQQQWIVCGLVSSRRFHFDVFAIPAPIVMLATALAILAICAWPFLRVALMNELEPLTISDAVLVAICTIIATAILTLAILDTFAYVHLTSIARQQLRDFSNKLALDYNDNVARAAAALDSIREKTKDAANWSPERIGDRLLLPDPREAKRRDPERIDPVKSYPYIISFSWVDDDGVERYKYATEPKNPRVNVGNRDYFLDAKNNKLWLTPSQPAPGTDGMQRIPFAIQWVRSAATGRVTTAIAERTGSSSVPVIVLATDLIDLGSAVAPPDVRFAIVDEQGNVVYHSEPQRIGYENLFAETDQSPALRSAVLGRRASFVETSYWGDNTEMFVRPLENSPWTLVVFRAKRLLRVLNEEAVLLTLLPLLLISLPYLLIYGVILVAAPRYRAPSLWPNPDRRGDYVRLARLYAILATAYAAAIYVFAPPSLPPIVFLFPAQAIVSTYVLLHRDDHRPRVGFALAFWIALTLALGVFIARATPDSGVLAAAISGRFWWIPKAIVLVLLAVAAIASLAFFMPAGEGGASRTKFRLSYSAGYRLCGALLLVVAAALPVVGFFKIATHIDLELYVKGAQLRMATMLEARINQLASLNAINGWSADVKRDVLGYDTAHVFGNAWCLTPPPLSDKQTCPTCDAPNRSTIPPLFPDVLPNLSEDFMGTRQLQEAASLDGLWSWCSEGDGPLKLDRLIRLPPVNANRLYPGTRAPEQQHLILSSTVPLVRETHPQGVAHLFALVTLSLLVFGIFWIAADFVARRLLLIDLAEPLWLAHVPLSPSLGDHIFLVRRDATADQLTGKGAGQPFYDVSFEAMSKNKAWDATLVAIDCSVAGRNVRITDFEYGVDDGETNWKKLEWLERLLALPDRTVIVLSAVSPSYVYTAPVKPPSPPPAPKPYRATPPSDGAVKPPPPDPATLPRARWEKVLSSFVWVTQEQLELRRSAAVESAAAQAAAPTPAKPAPKPDPNWLRRVGLRAWTWLEAVWRWLTNRLTFQHDRSDWIVSETEHDPFLKRLSDEVQPLRKSVPQGEEHERFLDEIGERARTYFAGLWASCSLEERVLLYQLARNGLLNGKDRRLVRRLMARGFIRRAPQLELFSETFRRYVLTAGRDDDLKHADTTRPSRWKDLRGALAILVVAFLLMLFATQKDLLSTAQGLATSLTASVPLIIKLLGLLGDRRGDAAARS
jgi:hypothetical protein